MTQPTAKRFAPPPIDKLPEDIRTRILAVQEKSGFVPNDPSIGDRPAARIMTPVEAPLLQPSMGLDPDRFSLLKKPLR